jgi:hypothetical protein
MTPEFLLPVHLGGVVTGAKGDVMHRAGAHAPCLRILVDNNIQKPTASIAFGRIAGAVSFFAELPIAHDAKQSIRVLQT